MLGRGQEEGEVDMLGLIAEEIARYDQVCFQYPERAAENGTSCIRGNGRLLRLMIRNLLENARRHGAPPIEISLEATATQLD